MNESMNLGGSVVSRNIYEKKGRLKWCVKEEGVTELDNGWRFLSEIDTEEYLSDPYNMVVCDWGTIVEIEPAIVPIFDMPVGTELTLEYDGSKKRFIDSETGDTVEFNFSLLE